MNDIIKDYKDEKFTKMDWLYFGLIAPALLVLVCVAVDIISNMF